MKKKPKFRIDPEFAAYMCQTGRECDEELKQDLIDNGGARDKLVVGELPDEDRVLVDGHRRYAVCEELGLHYDVEVLAFDTRDDVFDFMDRLALSRRNLLANEQSLIRGRMQKRRAAAKNVSVAAAEVASEQGVSERTVYRDKKYADAVENLDPAIRDKVVKDLPQKDAIELSKKPREMQAKALEDRGKPPKEVTAKTGRAADIWNAQQVMKTWIDAIGRWMNGRPSGIDSYRNKFPGAMGDKVLEAAKDLLNSLDAWKKGLK